MTFGMMSLEAGHPEVRQVPMVCVIDDDASLLRALRRGPLGTEQQRADEFIPILRGVEKRQLGVISIGIAPHC